MGRVFLLVVLGSLASFPARAEVKLEPYIGYWGGTMSQENNSDIAVKGLFYGSKIALAGDIWGLGADYLVGYGAGNQGGSTGGYDLTSYGPSAAVNLSKNFQFYATYFLSAKAELQKDRNPYKFSGSGYRIGLGGFGWGGFKRLSINFEYISRTYKKYNSVKLANELKEKGIGISLSIPFAPFGIFSADNSSAPSSGDE